MTIAVATPDGGTAQFPDGTSPDVMRNALRAKFGGGPAKGVAQDMSNKNDLSYRSTVLPLGKTNEGKIVPAVPEMIHGPWEALKRIMSDPGNAQPADVLQVLPVGGGGFATAGLATSAAAKIAESAIMKSSVPETAALRAAKTAAYNIADNSGVRIKPDSFKDFATDLVGEMKKEAFDRDLHPKSAAVIRRVAEDLGSSPTLTEFDNLRKLAVDASKSNEPADRRVAGIIIDKMDDFLDDLSKKQTLSPDESAAVNSLTKARALAKQTSKSEEIDQMFEKALNNSPDYRAAGFENSLRVQFKQLANNTKKMRRYSAAEKDAIRQAARGSKIESALVKIGKFSPTAGFFGMLLSGEALLNTLGHPELLAIPLAGGAARRIATKMRLGRAQRVSTMVRGGEDVTKRLDRLRNIKRVGMAATAAGAGIGGASALLNSGQ